MKKNALLTFLFACVPGAGQMYYGYMQRGLSLISIFSASLFLTFSLRAEGLLLLGAIVWMYSFFDTYDLLRYAAAGTPKEDNLLLIGNLGDFSKYVPQHNKLLGWLLILLGAYGVYTLVLENVLTAMLRYFLGNDAWWVARSIPGVVISVLFITAGLWLLGLRPPQAPIMHVQDLPPYPQEPETPADPDNE